MTRPRILIVEDDRDGSRSVAEAVEDIGFEAVTAQTGEEGVRRCREQRFEAVLSDLMLPDIDGLRVLAEVRKTDREAPVLIMTAYGSVQSAVEALKSGAYDYITKPLDLDDLQSKVKRAVETRRLRGEVAQLQQTIHNRYSADSMVAESDGMREVVAQVRNLADTTATVLILGESGTGKELVARALHVDGGRAGGPFVAANCGAFSETLLDSELFGHEKGAFTGATQQRKGAFERADEGTLFLDEIADAPQSVQVKLLRVLEEREVVRLGGQESIGIDARLISASNKDLDALIGSGEFREDLFYRLKVVTIAIPPLRDRRDDIRPLADRFIALACKEHGREIASVGPDYYSALEGFDWPGNVRQLRNVVETSVLMALGPALRGSDTRLDAESRPSGTRMAISDNMTFTEMEREILSQALSRWEGNRTLVAEKLGLSRRTIQRKIQDFNLPY